MSETITDEDTWTLDEWTDFPTGSEGNVCEVLGEHDRMFVFNLPNEDMYLVLNATTGVAFWAGWPRLSFDFGTEAKVNPLVMRDFE